MKNFLILGCGNMAQAMVLGFFDKTKNDKPKFNFSFYTPSQTKAQSLARKTGGTHLPTITQLDQYDVILLACKPQQFFELSLELKNKIKKSAVVISILAGVSVQKLEESLQHSKIIRVMPNTPSLIGEGSNLVYFNSNVASEEREDILYFLSAKFQPHVFKFEDEIDKITGVIASGPAYIFEFARIFSSYLQEKCNLNQELSKKLTQELFLGSVHLMNSSDKSFEDLRNQVTSKGGVTFAALESFREDKLQFIFETAFAKAYLRTRELSEAISASK